MGTLRLEHLKVLVSVVGPISVDVVDYLPISERPAKLFLSNDPVPMLPVRTIQVTVRQGAILSDSLHFGASDATPRDTGTPP